MRRFLFITTLTLAALLYVAKGLFERYTAAFPELRPGIYVGTIVSNSKQSEPIPWLVARFAGEQSLSVCIGDVRIAAQRVAPLDPSGKTRLPLLVGEGAGRIRLTGALIEEDRYEGRFHNPATDSEGVWKLARLKQEATPQMIEQGLVRWFAVRQEIERIELEIKRIQEQADQQRSSIDNLHRYVSDDDTLRKTAGDRLGKVDVELEEARNELVKRQQQLDEAIRDFELSQRISQEGKLVFLSRETIQRESRWIELSLKLVAPETSLGFDQAFERAEKIQRLKAAIRRERESVVERSRAERYRGGSDETRREEEFYGVLRQ